MTSLERDTLSRKRIVSEMDKNFFVEAGAGSGKTTMLVKRMVAMVESGIDIRKFIQTDYGNYAIQWLTAQSDPASFTDVADLKEAISAIDSYLK